jgi:hypothetical protein
MDNSKKNGEAPLAASFVEYTCFDPENGGNMLLQNVSVTSQKTVSSSTVVLL